LKEVVAEKMRAAATRLTIAPRDFYDIAFLIKVGFDFQDKSLWQLFKQKLIENNYEPDLVRYRINMGRPEAEIKDMASRIEVELLDVLTPNERKKFDLDKTLRLFNDTFKDIE